MMTAAYTGGICYMVVLLNVGDAYARTLMKGNTKYQKRLESILHSEMSLGHAE